MKTISTIEEVIPPKYYEALVSLMIASPVFFLIRANWIIGLSLLLILGLSYWNTQIFMKLRKDVQGFWFLAWGYSSLSIVVGVSISQYKEFYDAHKSVYVTILILGLLGMVRLYRNLRKWLSEYGKP